MPTRDTQDSNHTRKNTRKACADLPQKDRQIHFLTINYHCSALVNELVGNITTSGGTNKSIVIVDNSPNDPGLNNLDDRPDIKVLRAPTNLGFGGGCNLGLNYISSNDPTAIAWLLNPDAILMPDAIDTVRAALEEIPDTAILGTQIIDLDNQIWFDKGLFNPWLGRLTHKHLSQHKHNRIINNSLSEQCDWISGCSLILNLTALNTTPLFDTQIFLDYEDAELCLRLKKQGHQPRVTKAALVKHAVSSITGRSPRAKYRHATFSKLYLLHKHGTRLSLFLNMLYFALRPLTLTKSEPVQAQGRWAGLADFLIWLIRLARGDQRVIHPRTAFTAGS